MAYAILCLFLLAYLAGASFSFSMSVKVYAAAHPIVFLCLLLPFVSLSDFLVRLSFQVSTAPVLRPYLLLPVPVNIVAFHTVAVTVFSIWGCLFWLAACLPYIVVIMQPHYGCEATWLSVFYVAAMSVVNGMWYMVCRTLVGPAIKWCLLPFVLYLLQLGLVIAVIKGADGRLLEYWESCFASFMALSPFIQVAVVAAVVAFGIYIVNVVLVRALTREKCGRVAGFSMDYLSRFCRRYSTSITGRFVCCEACLIMRNRHPRKLWFSSLFIQCAVSALLLFVDHNNAALSLFWCTYCLGVSGMLLMPRVLGYLGNYFDGVMMREQMIFRILSAKYIVLCMLVLVPCLLLLPPVFSGKCSGLVFLSSVFYTVGPQSFVLFLLVPVNRQKLPLNAQTTAKTALGKSYVLIFTEIAAMACPSVLFRFFSCCLSENTVCCMLVAVGILFVMTHKVWIRYISHRLYVSRYGIRECLCE